KCEFHRQEVCFLGYVISAQGIQMDEGKVKAVRYWPVPGTIKELQRFLGFANFYRRFIQGYSGRSTARSAGPPYEKPPPDALKSLKHNLVNAPVMSYFHPDRETNVIVDASPVGLGGILAQRDKTTDHTYVVAYASRALTPVEQRYLQTEREALAIVWNCEDFHLYLYGAEFNMITDHKPLELIFNNPKSKPPARIERWALRLQPYKYKVIYKAGKTNPADYMSHHPQKLHKSTITDDVDTEIHIRLIADNAVPKAMTLEEAKAKTANDNVLQYRIVMPKTLQQRALELAHEGHQGLVKTKQLLREKVWFPRINKQAEHLLLDCIPCQASSTQIKHSPLQMSELPEGPWQNVSVDFCGPFPSGDYLLVILDEYSRFPFVEITPSTSANKVFPFLDKVFIAGIPKIMKSDNGPPFFSQEMANFTTHLGIHHRKITPYWPQANGEVERFMRTIKKATST
ncbi:hypothetical protein HF521_014839, partial [Silurus meridionalis]